jgi:phospholipid/cholesterol/gamma-HCH transport system permease protein
MHSPPPRVQSVTTPVAAIQARGHWTAAQLADTQQWNALEQDLRRLPRTAMQPAWDLRPMERLDHIGAQVLWNHWGRGWPANVQMQSAHQEILQRVARLTSAPPIAENLGLRHAYGKLGEGVLHALAHGRFMTRLIGQLFLDTLHLVRAPRQGPWRDISGHLYRIGATALPITALVGFLIGVVLAYLTAQQLKQFGADSFIVDILGVSLIRELGPVLAAILLAGRSGSAITAQIGVMRVTEELDAMRVMGIPHGFRLVLPRVLASSIAMPLIAVWTTVMALSGGMLAADIALGISPDFFVRALPTAVDIRNLSLALGKSVVFGALIALIGCHFGLRIKPNTESLGEGTTASVVTSITAVILVDAVFAVVFKDVGL